jgi:hypothetical protein
VLVDEAHFNFHTAGERYRAFAELLRSDGYVVEPSNRKFTREALGGGRLLVIANALAERNGSGNWTLPTPSAFTDEEIAAVKQWVEGGGSLLLIADHMPFPGAAEKLAAAFDVTLNNGFAVTPARPRSRSWFSGRARSASCRTRRGSFRPPRRACRSTAGTRGPPSPLEKDAWRSSARPPCSRPRWRRTENGSG